MIDTVLFRGRGGERPTVSHPVGSVKVWVKDGTLFKYTYSVQGTLSFEGKERQINRTTTVEITDPGSTQFELPAELKDKLSTTGAINR